MTEKKLSSGEINEILDKMSWLCLSGHPNPDSVRMPPGFRETVKFCGVCGKPRTKPPLDRTLKTQAIFHSTCSVSFDGDLQVVADGRHRGLWFWGRQIDSLEQDSETALLLEWDEVKAIRERIVQAEKVRENPEKLIALCAKEFEGRR